jgi:hypothetical protein
MDRRNRFCFRPRLEVLEERALPNNFFSPGSGLGPDLVGLIHRHEEDLLMAASNRFKPLVIPGNGPNPDPGGSGAVLGPGFRLYVGNFGYCRGRRGRRHAGPRPGHAAQKSRRRPGDGRGPQGRRRPRDDAEGGGTKADGEVTRRGLGQGNGEGSQRRKDESRRVVATVAQEGARPGASGPAGRATARGCDR